MKFHRLRTFSLVELLVSISLVTVLMSMLLPGLAAAKRKATFARWVAHRDAVRVHKNVICHYDFQTGGGRTLKNRAVAPEVGTLYVPDAFDATISASPLWKKEGRWRGSKSALLFNGTNGYVDCGGEPMMDLTDAFSIEVWMSANDQPNTGYIFSRNLTNTAGIQYAAWLRDDNALRFKVRGRSWNPGYVLPVGEWTHLIFTVKSGDTMKLYVNGELHKSRSCPAIAASTSDQRLADFCIGARNHGTTGHRNYYEGLIDELAVYNAAFTDGQVEEHYSRGRP